MKLPKWKVNVTIDPWGLVWWLFLILCFVALCSEIKDDPLSPDRMVPVEDKP